LKIASKLPDAKNRTASGHQGQVQLRRGAQNHPGFCAKQQRFP
jgi:hypothetical protein